MKSRWKLYSYFRSSSAYRVRIAMNLKGLEYDLIPIHLLKAGGEQHRDDYVKMNPSHQVPTLLDGTQAIGQSMAILEYLEEKVPTPALLPSTPLARASVRQLCEVINSGIQPLQNLAVTQFLASPLNASEDQKKQWMNHWITKGFESFEKLLQTHSEQFCYGNEVSLADCFLVPQMFSARRFNIDLNPFPLAVQITERCEQLEAFQKAAPQNQPDAE